MAARAIHNVFKMTESTMSVTSEGIRLIDPSSNTVRVEFSLQDVSFWAAHAENNRLLGFITRNRSNSPAAAKAGPPALSFACHVFETNSTSEDERKKGLTPQKPKMTPVLSDKALLLETINQLDDHEDSAEDLPISPDGRFLLLSTDSDPFSPTSPTFQIGDKGAAGDTEAADAENPDSESEA
ncbi:hypothetical protein BaRGS_00025939 [Batillaria attramentaria]|uniref:PID domain-containing protein n=1 Tax=Batillaria attramentaria TaxID=370345 RepID=A0ABD0K793_9CAEN